MTAASSTATSSRRTSCSVREGRAKVTDFGIARARDTEGMTLTGTIMGTSDYIPPEQARGETAGEGGDAYRSASCSSSCSPRGCPTRATTPSRSRCAT